LKKSEANYRESPNCKEFLPFFISLAGHFQQNSKRPTRSIAGSADANAARPVGPLTLKRTPEE